MADTYGEKIAEWTRAALAKYGITSSRQAELHTRGAVTYSTIQNMLSGRRPGENVVIKFAGAFGEDVADALRFFGYEAIADLWERGARKQQEDRAAAPPPRRRYEADPDADGRLAKITALYEGIDNPDDQDELVQFALMKWRRRHPGEKPPVDPNSEP